MALEQSQTWRESALSSLLIQDTYLIKYKDKCKTDSMWQLHVHYLNEKVK